MMSSRSTWGQNPEGPPYNSAQGDLPDKVFELETRGKRCEANKYHQENYEIDFEYDD
jgi:hypothetical protein